MIGSRLKYLRKTSPIFPCAVNPIFIADIHIISRNSGSYCGVKSRLKRCCKFLFPRIIVLHTASRQIPDINLISLDADTLVKAALKTLYQTAVLRVIYGTLPAQIRTDNIPVFQYTGLNKIRISPVKSRNFLIVILFPIPCVRTRFPGQSFHPLYQMGIVIRTEIPRIIIAILAGKNLDPVPSFPNLFPKPFAPEKLLPLPIWGLQKITVTPSFFNQGIFIEMPPVLILAVSIIFYLIFTI